MAYLFEKDAQYNFLYDGRNMWLNGLRLTIPDIAYIAGRIDLDAGMRIGCWYDAAESVDVLFRLLAEQDFDNVYITQLQKQPSTPEV